VHLPPPLLLVDAVVPDLLVHARHSRHILISSNIEVPAAVLRAHEREQDHVGIHAAHEDADDETILVPRHLSFRRERELLADGGLDGRAGRRHEVSELVAGADDEGTEAAGGQLHKVDGDDAPGALNAELLEEGRGDDGVAAGEGVGVQQRAAEDTHDDNAQPAAEDGRAIANECAARHGAEVGDDLGDGDAVGAEVVLVAQHRRVQVLAAVGHEIEAGHEENHVDEQDPVLLERVLAHLHEEFGRVGLLFADPLALLIGLGLGQAEAEYDDEDGGAGAEPEEGSPAVADGVDEGAREDGREKIAERIALLQHAGDDTTCRLRAVFKCWMSSVTGGGSTRGKAYQSQQRFRIDLPSQYRTKPLQRGTGCRSSRIRYQAPAR
jgi:hypothetical protein